MKLQHKLALFNIFTKIAIIAISGLFVTILTNNISINHLQGRLIDKKNKLISNLSMAEINELVNMQKTFTDYNILKEEYIIIDQVPKPSKRNTKIYFSTEERQVDDESQKYLIMTNYFTFGGKFYRLEIGETMNAVSQIETTLLYFTLLTLVISVIASLLVEMTFTRFLLIPFYQIINLKLNNVNDPIHYNSTHIETSTEDFRLLDDSISALMKKISNQIIIQKQFITNVSHELLTPISLMMPRLENLLNDENLSDKGMNKIVASLKTLNRLKSIIHSLLLISKVEHNQFIKNDIILINKLIEEIYGELKDRLPEKDIKIQIKLLHHFEVFGNEALVHILCTNIINNAIKYNKAGGKVIITDSLSTNAYILYIKDEGIGMNPDEIELAFNRFERLGTSEADSYGLGLAIVKSIAAFHDIGVSVISNKKSGTTASITFPRQALNEV